MGKRSGSETEWQHHKAVAGHAKENHLLSVFQDFIRNEADRRPTQNKPQGKCKEIIPGLNEGKPTNPPQERAGP